MQTLTGCLPIEIEHGRYCNIPWLERKCKLCNNEVGDEIHFLLKCKALEAKRQACLNELKDLESELDPFKQINILMDKPYKLGKLIDNLWQRRNFLLQTKSK